MSGCNLVSGWHHLCMVTDVNIILCLITTLQAIIRKSHCIKSKYVFFFFFPATLAICVKTFIWFFLYIGEIADIHKLLLSAFCDEK